MMNAYRDIEKIAEILIKSQGMKYKVVEAMNTKNNT